MLDSKEAKTYYLIAISARNYFLNHQEVQTLRTKIAGKSPFVSASGKDFQQKKYPHTALLSEVAKKWIDLAKPFTDPHSTEYVFKNIFELLFYLEILVHCQLNY